MYKGLVLSALSLVLLAGCSSKSSSSSPAEDPDTATYQGPPETTYCSSSISYSGAITIQGDAQYVRREPYAGGLGKAALTGLHHANAYPIRHAEVRVLSASGAVAQCAQTDAVGHFSFALPTDGSTYTIYVNSRANNSYLVASVLNKPRYNAFYSLTTTVVANTSKSVGTLTAAATGDLLGAAFNILDQIHFANDFLRSKAGSGLCSAVTAQCTDFTVTPKISAYWAPGFNPNSYFGDPDNGLSFYLPGYSRLFILGGINGDTDNSDTDHYDNSVIVHEFGHFLEDSMFASDSPGGSHNGNRVIDPRLAWSEGWGNFFQAAVLNASGYTDPSYNWVSCQTVSDSACPSYPAYTDTIGNADGTTSIAFNVDLETPDGHDDPNFAGEGNFREFSVTRFLWDVNDAASAETQYGGTDNINDQFVQIWAALTKSSGGFKDSSLAFRNVGLLDLIHTQIAGSNTWSSVQTLNRHFGDESRYAQYVTTGSTCTYSLTPASVSGDTGSLSSSDLFRNNRFYHLNIASSGTYTLQLDYVDADGSGTVADLDLYLYNESARFGVSSDMVTYSRETPTQVPAATQTEAATVSLSPGHYLINVNVYTGGSLGGAVNFTLKLNGSQLCPASYPP